MALSSFGTSWASTILSKDTVAESTTNTIQSKDSGEVVGFQDVGYTFELDALGEDEFEERRLLVHEALMDDYDHEDHQHRKLVIRWGDEKVGNNNNNKNNKQIVKIAWDQGKIRERDLYAIIRRCDASNSVNIRRKWKSVYEEDVGDYDYDTICGPGTVVVKKCKKKRNRGKTKVKCILDRVELRQVGVQGKDKSIVFQCDKGGWYVYTVCIIACHTPSCIWIWYVLSSMFSFVKYPFPTAIALDQH